MPVREIAAPNSTTPAAGPEIVGFAATIVVPLLILALVLAAVAPVVVPPGAVVAETDEAAEAAGLATPLIAVAAGAAVTAAGAVVAAEGAFVAAAVAAVVTAGATVLPPLPEPQAARIAALAAPAIPLRNERRVRCRVGDIGACSLTKIGWVNVQATGDNWRL